jgi:hypothetical protein
MDIHSRIGYKLDSGEVLSVYTAKGGDPELLGPKLLQRYNNMQNVSSLIGGGNMDVIESSTTWDNTPANPRGPLYYKDRGDANVGAKLHQSSDHFLQETLTDAGSWAYLYTDRYSDGEFRWVYFNIPETVPSGHQITDYVSWKFVS